MLLSWTWPMSPRVRRRYWRRLARTGRTLRSPVELHISVRTVESHVSALLRKLDASDRRALAVIADRARMGTFVGLPASMTTFVGRSYDRAAILAALDGSRLVTVVGPGGVGKTRLVAIVAGGAQSRFPAGGAFVDLVPVRAGSVLRRSPTRWTRWRAGPICRGRLVRKTSGWPAAARAGQLRARRR